MATSTRTIFQGDTWPVLKGEASDDTGVLDLSVANSLTMEAIASGANPNIIGAAVAIQPPEADSDGTHHWNWKYVWVVGDTVNLDLYSIYLKVIWDVAGQEIQTFGPDSLSIIKKPV